MVLLDNVLCNDQYIILYTEFSTNDNWGYIVSVHPGLTLHKSLHSDYHVNMCNLHTTSKLYTLCTSPYVCII